MIPEILNDAAPGPLGFAVTPDGAVISGHVRTECYDADGNLKWVDETHNMITNTALTALLDSFLRNQTPPTTIYMGLVDNASFSAFAAGDTYATSGHSGWIENTNYSQSTRPSWTTVAASGQSITNSSAVVFSINAASQVIKGIFTVYGSSTNTKGDFTSGAGKVLFSTAAFSGGNQSCNSGDTLNVTYTISASSS